MLITWRNLVLNYSEKFLKWGNLKHVLLYFQTSCQYVTDYNTYDENCKKSLNIMQFYRIPETADVLTFIPRRSLHGTVQ